MNNLIYKECDYELDIDKKILNQICNCKSVVKEIHIDIYTEKPYILFARIIEKKVTILNSDNRIIFYKKDRYKTIILNLLFNEIENCFVKKYSDKQYAVLFTIHNISYKILIII